MKKYILSVLVSIAFYGNSQTFTLNPRTTTGVATCTGISAFQVGVTNNGTGDLFLSYSLIINTLPDTTCWTETLCDCNVCHPDNTIPTTDNCYTKIASGATNAAFMIFDVKDTKGHFGSGKLQYLVYETSNPSNKDTLTFNMTGCTTGNACLTGIEENHLGDLVVYPSLANDKIYIKNDVNVKHIESLKIYDMLGKVVHTEKHVDLSSGKKEVNVNSLPAGIYFVELSEGLYSTTKKFVKVN